MPFISVTTNLVLDKRISTFTYGKIKDTSTHFRTKYGIIMDHHSILQVFSNTGILLEYKKGGKKHIILLDPVYFHLGAVPKR